MLFKDIQAVELRIKSSEKKVKEFILKYRRISSAPIDVQNKYHEIVNNWHELKSLKNQLENKILKEAIKQKEDFIRSITQLVEEDIESNFRFVNITNYNSVLQSLNRNQYENQ